MDELLVMGHPDQIVPIKSSRSKCLGQCLAGGRSRIERKTLLQLATRIVALALIQQSHS